MLSALQVKIAVIEQADLVFHPDLMFLTGETGQENPLSSTAISAILGERVSGHDSSQRRQGLGQALFQQVPELPWFQEMGLPMKGRR